MRLQVTDLPNATVDCDITPCVYNMAGKCDTPRVNKGNSDASCHRMSNKDLIRDHLIDTSDIPELTEEQLSKMERVNFDFVCSECGVTTRSPKKKGWSTFKIEVKGGEKIRFRCPSCSVKN